MRLKFIPTHNNTLKYYRPKRLLQYDWFERINLDIPSEKSFFFARRRSMGPWFKRWVFK